MKTSTKRIIVIAVVLILLGALLTGGVYLFYDGLIGVYRSNGSWKTVAEVAERVDFTARIDDFSKMNINMNYARIEIVSGDEFILEYRGSTVDEKIEYEVANDTLTINGIVEKGNNISLNFFSFGPYMTTENKIIITIPSQHKLEETIVKSKTSSMQISDVNSTIFTLESNHGNITVNNIDTEQAKISMSTGNLITNNISATNLTLQEEHGNITLSDVRVKEKTEVKISTGNVTISALETEDFLFQGENGNFTGKEMLFSTGDVTSSTGMIRVDATVTKELNTAATHGNITVNLTGSEDDYDVSVASRLGNISVGGKKDGNHYYNKNAGNPEIKIENDTANITVTFKNH